MGIRELHHCVSNDPYFTKYVMSESTPGIVYSIQIQLPGDAPDTWVCTCPSYQYRGRCKHIHQVYSDGICLWDEISGPEVQTDAQRSRQLCPRCGNDTSSYLALEDENDQD